MTSRQLNAVFMLFKWVLCAIAVYVLWCVAEHIGMVRGEQGLNYWRGWQDAMIQTDYGRIPYDSTQSALR